MAKAIQEFFIIIKLFNFHFQNQKNFAISSISFLFGIAGSALL